MPRERKTSEPKITPVIRVAPLGELKVFLITESELDELKRGSAASLAFNLFVFFFPIALSLLVTLLTTEIPSQRRWAMFAIFFSVSVVAAFVSLVTWLYQKRRSGDLAESIRNRMGPLQAIQELPPAAKELSDSTLDSDSKP